MKLALLVLTLAALQTAPPQPAPLTAVQCKCSIEVAIKRADTGEPINDVDVTLTPNAPVNPALSAAVAAGDQAQIQALLRAQANTPPETRMAVTDSSGNAAFRDLAEGTYNIRAVHDGYLGPAANGIVNNQATTSVRVGPSNGNTAANANAPQPNPHVTLTMIRGATISGKLLDSNRQPASGVSVAAYRVAYRNGLKTINQAGNAVQTDDRGEFRIYWFPPGDYLVRTTTDRPALQNQNYPASTYYPGTLDPSRAVPLVLKEGQELSGADFTLQAAAGVTISGTIVNNMPGRVGPRGQVLRIVASMFLVPRNATFFETPQLLSNARSAAAGARGAAPDDTNSPFEIRGVPPGTYDFYPVYNGDAAGSATSYFTGRTTIEVGSDNITNVVSVIRPGVSLSGKISIVGTPPPTPRPQTINNANIRVNIQALDNLPSLVQAGLRNNPLSTTGADGTFTVSGFIDARYFVSAVTGLPQDAYVSDMRLGSQSFYNEGWFDIGKTTPDAMEIVVSRGGGVIQGVVQDPQHKTISARIALVPEAPRKQNLLLYENATILGGNGSFAINGVAPGAYKLFAFESIPQGADQNEEFMRPFESRGVNVTVSAGITTGNVVVPIIPDGH